MTTSAELELTSIAAGETTFVDASVELTATDGDALDSATADATTTAIATDDDGATTVTTLTSTVSTDGDDGSAVAASSDSFAIATGETAYATGSTWGFAIDTPGAADVAVGTSYAYDVPVAKLIADRMAVTIPLAVAGGVTTIQVLPGSANLFGGRSVTLRLVPARSVQAMKVPGAPYGLKMACGENPKRVYRDKGGPVTRMGNVAGYRKAFEEAGGTPPFDLEGGRDPSVPVPVPAASVAVPVPVSVPLPVSPLQPATPVMPTAAAASRKRRRLRPRGSPSCSSIPF